jgi:hypothetical protein
MKQSPLLSSRFLINGDTQPLLVNIHETKPVAEQQILNKRGYVAVAGKLP